MSGGSVRLRVLMPGKVVADEEADIVILRTVDGDKGIMPNHEPCSVVLSHGLLRLRRGAARVDAFIVAGGFATVRDGQVTVMTPVADTPELFSRAVEAVSSEREQSKLQEQAVDKEITRAEALLRQTLVRRDISAYAILKGQLEKGDDADEGRKAGSRRRG